MSASAVPKQRVSVVVVEARLPTGEKVTQEIPVQHDPGANEAQIINAAIVGVRANGGLMTGDADSVTLYPILIFMDGIKFSVKRVVLAVSSLAVQ